MFGVRVEVVFEPLAKLVPAVNKAKFKNFGHAAARIRKDAVDSIKAAPPEARKRAKRRGGRPVRRATHEPSPPGSPPYTGRRRFLKRAIRYAVDERGAIIGPSYGLVGESGQAHEFGGTYKEAEYPERPFMGPALEKNLDRMLGDWEASIGP